MVREETAQRTNTEASVKDISKRTVAAVWTGIISCIIVMVIIILFLIFGVSIVASYPHCDALYFGTEEPNAFILPDLRNLSLSEQISLLAGSYKVSNEYNLKLTQGNFGVISLCVLKRHFTQVSACVKIGTPNQLQHHVICGPDMRPDCLPGSIVEHYLGLSLWYQEESTVVYTVVDVDSGKIGGRNITNTTATLSSIWYGVLDCQVFVNLTIAVIFFGSMIIICCLGCAGCCLWICCQCYKEKRYRQLRGQEQNEEIALTNYKENEGSRSERSEPFEEEMDEEAESLVPSELHQNELSNAGQDVSSCEEEDMQVELHPAGGAPSRESVHTAVSERSYQRRGRRSRFVPAKRPMAGYFTDSTLMSGAATDVSTNDASDEDSSAEAGSCVSGRLSSSATQMVQEATGVGTPPPYAHFHPTTVYDHRPEVTAEPRRPPDGM